MAKLGGVRTRDAKDESTEATYIFKERAYSALIAQVLKQNGILKLLCEPSRGGSSAHRDTRLFFSLARLLLE
jgi:hypothetical protein